MRKNLARSASLLKFATSQRLLPYTASSGTLCCCWSPAPAPGAPAGAAAALGPSAAAGADFLPHSSFLFSCSVSPLVGGPGGAAAVAPGAGPA
eukprot:CAMPEP_0202393006 /NCGR_PEP_ID=MMETSP1127-20130417/92677_1 /ASSEMBLY_ACC=CAM_ASM_000462 /TAXON_ID=3047 /ORGANISM="Dunaliella tertiolecta, Strain CCMP1320" /LENGTH=92 /DNA_ID=CAMNT_0048995557 /DNA_START=327 /DNA_END=605 /DNA_ORIENTATION=+